MLIKNTILILCIFISSILGNTEKVIFSPETTDCTPLSALTVSYQAGAILTHPYTSLRTSLSSPSAQLYQLHDLVPESNYEVRLSYPATVPTDFQFTLVCNGSKSRVSGVLIQGAYAAVSNQPDIHKMPVPVNIVLEELALGVVYHGIYNVILAIVIAMALGHFIFIPQIKRVLRSPSKEN